MIEHHDADGEPDPAVAREEIFGPARSVIPGGDADEALQITNDSRYGPDGAVRAGTQERAFAFARRMESGTVDANEGAT